MKIKLQSASAFRAEDTNSHFAYIVPTKERDDATLSFLIVAEFLIGDVTSPRRVILSETYPGFAEAISAFDQGFKVKDYAEIADVADMVNVLLNEHVAVEV